MVPAVSGSYALVVNQRCCRCNPITELIAYAKANPGKLSYASAGIGSTLHLAAEFFKRAAGIDIFARALQGRGAGHARTWSAAKCRSMIGPVVAVLPLAQAGKIRALAVASAKRSALAPELPTMIESGVAGFEVTSWYGLAAPTGTPKAAITRLNAETNQALQSAEVVDAVPPARLRADRRHARRR